MTNQKCYHDKHGDFYVVEIIGQNGSKRYYAVYFTLSKAGRKADLNLFVASAHARNEMPYERRLKPIGFNLLDHNSWIGKPVKPAP